MLSSLIGSLELSEEEAVHLLNRMPSDLAFYHGNTHVGIIGGIDKARNLTVIHCSSGRNSVVITGTSGFASVGYPYYYNE